MRLTSFMMLGGLICVAQLHASLTADQIVQRSADHLHLDHAISELSIEIIRPKWTKKMRLKTWTKGDELAMAYVQSPKKDSGTVFLKNTEGVYNYLPKIRRTVKMPRQLLTQKWMGTDLSVADLVNGSKFNEDYKAKLMGTQLVNGRSCYYLRLKPKEEAEVLWGLVELWIDVKTYNPMRVIYYDEDERQVHSIVGGKIRKLGGKAWVSEFIARTAGKNGQSTRVTTHSLILNQALTDDFFSKENMRKLKP